jgi:hypothetical protein
MGVRLVSLCAVEIALTRRSLAWRFDQVSRVKPLLLLGLRSNDGKSCDSRGNPLSRGIGSHPESKIPALACPPPYQSW